MQIIDAHVHWRPRSVLDRICRRKDYPRAEPNRCGGYSLWGRAGDQDPLSDVTDEWFELDAMFQHMESRGHEIGVVSSVGAFAIAFSYFESEEGRELAIQWNEETASLQRRHAGRFWGTAAVPLVDTRIAIAVMEDAVTRLGLVGVSLPGNSAGDPRIDADRLEPFYGRAEALGTTLFLHPSDGLFPALLNEYDGALYRTIIGVGEVSIAASRLVLSGIMERHPRLKVLMSHTGGALPYQSGRMDRSAAAAKLAAPPSESMKRMYTDTVSPQAEGIRFAVEYYGADHVLFGSDYPCWNSQDSLKFFADAGVAAADQDKIYRANARHLLGLDAAEARASADRRLARV